MIDQLAQDVARRPADATARPPGRRRRHRTAELRAGHRPRTSSASSTRSTSRGRRSGSQLCEPRAIGAEQPVRDRRSRLRAGFGFRRTQLITPDPLPDSASGEDLYALTQGGVFPYATIRDRSIVDFSRLINRSKIQLVDARRPHRAEDFSPVAARIEIAVRRRSPPRTRTERRTVHADIQQTLADDRRPAPARPPGEPRDPRASRRPSARAMGCQISQDPKSRLRDEA